MSPCREYRPLARYPPEHGRDDGFTLVELLVVLVILGLVTAIAAPQVVRYLDGSKVKAAQIQINRLAGSLDLFRLDVGRYPTEEEGLAILIDPPDTRAGWNGPYLRNRDGLVDPWGRPYLYRAPGDQGEFDIVSLGADGQTGGEGRDRDIGSR